MKMSEFQRVNELTNDLTNRIRKLIKIKNYYAMSRLHYNYLLYIAIIE